MKPSYEEGAVVFSDKIHYDNLINKGVDAKKLKLTNHSLKRIKSENNLIINFHGNHKGLVIDKRIYHPIDIIKASRSIVKDLSSTRCIDIFACQIGTGIQSSDKTKQRLEKQYKDNLLEGEYVIT